MNLYEVVSEMLKSGGYYEPPEWGRVWEIVAARNHSQARYLAWKHDQRGSAYVDPIEEMPRMFCRLLRRDIGGEPGIRTRDEALWRPLLEAAPEWRVLA